MVSPKQCTPSQSYPYIKEQLLFRPIKYQFTEYNTEIILILTSVPLCAQLPACPCVWFMSKPRVPVRTFHTVKNVKCCAIFVPTMEWPLSGRVRSIPRNPDWSGSGQKGEVALEDWEEIPPWLLSVCQPLLLEWRNVIPEPLQGISYKTGGWLWAGLKRHTHTHSYLSICCSLTCGRSRPSVAWAHLERRPGAQQQPGCWSSLTQKRSLDQQHSDQRGHQTTQQRALYSKLVLCPSTSDQCPFTKHIGMQVSIHCCNTSDALINLTTGLTFLGCENGLNLDPFCLLLDQLLHVARGLFSSE